MKHLFFVAVATGIFSGTTISVKAQTNVNIEKYGDGALVQKFSQIYRRHRNQSRRLLHIL
jgi:hypothetical protein